MARGRKTYTPAQKRKAFRVFCSSPSIVACLERLQATKGFRSLSRGTLYKWIEEYKWFERRDQVVRQAMRMEEAGIATAFANDLVIINDLIDRKIEEAKDSQSGPGQAAKDLISLIKSKVQI